MATERASRSAAGLGSAVNVGTARCHRGQRKSKEKAPGTTGWPFLE